MRKTHNTHCHKSFSHNCQNENKKSKQLRHLQTQFPSPSPSPSSPSMDLPPSKPDRTLDAFATVSSSTRVFWNSRRRSGSKRNLDKLTEDANPDIHNDNSNNDTPKKQDDDETMQDISILSERRRALFEPLEPLTGARNSAESLLPPPDFDSANYPRGWLIGKKRKLVNVDVVESMRRIAVQEMNRKDREINGLNEQLEDDSRCLEHLQIQLLQERSKRAEVERENAMLKEQLSMLMNMLQENEAMVNEGTEEN